MIILRNDDHLLLVTQPDHAALAAMVMSAWRADGFPVSRRRDDVIFATAHHDDGWLEVDRSPLVSSADGGLLDFISAPDEVRLAVWPRAVARLAATPYVAALVAQHALQIFGHRGAMDLRAFLSEMQALRDSALADAAPLILDDLVSDYFFVGMGDTLSLTFCNRWTEPRRQAQYDIRLRGSRLTIDPDPFEGQEVPLTVTARKLPNRSFASFTPGEASAAFDAAPSVTLTGILSGPVTE